MKFEKGYTPWNKGLPKEKQPMYGRTGKNNPKYGKPGYWRGKKNPEQSKRMSKANPENINPSRGDGKYTTTDGYILILMPKHPYCNKQGYIRESHLIAEKALGRHLKLTELTHHINEYRPDNRNCNLLICEKGYHNWLHGKLRRIK